MIYLRNERGLAPQGRAIGYEVHGEGPAVLLLHPFPFDRNYWANLVLADFRVIAIDARGYGDSELGEPGYSIDDLGDDAVALLDHLGVAMSAVVGASMGGYVALSIAERHAARVSCLVLCGSRAGGDSEEARANRRGAIAQIKQHDANSFLDGVGVRLCGRSSHAQVEVQRLAEASSRDFARALPATIGALRDRPDRSALLPKLRLPTLIIVGDEDAVTPPDEARAMHRAIPGAELVEIERCGHLPSREQPEIFTTALAEFLTKTLLPD